MRRSSCGISSRIAAFSRSDTKSMRACGCRSRSRTSSGDASTMLPMPQSLSTRIFETALGGGQRRRRAEAAGARPPAARRARGPRAGRSRARADSDDWGARRSPARILSPGRIPPSQHARGADPRLLGVGAPDPVDERRAQEEPRLDPVHRQQPVVPDDVARRPRAQAPARPPRGGRPSRSGVRARSGSGSGAGSGSNRRRSPAGRAPARPAPCAAAPSARPAARGGRRAARSRRSRAFRGRRSE